MFWLLLTVISVMYNIDLTIAKCTHENNYGVYFIYCENLTSLDEIDSTLYETNPIRVFIKNSSLALTKSKIFKGSFLRELEIIGSKISVIESNFLKSLEQMGKFTVQDGEVVTLEPFPELKYLYHVTFSGNKISHIPPDFMQKLSGLYAASLKNFNSNLKNLPSDMFKNTPVQYLRLDNLFLDVLDSDSLHTLTKLRSLSVSSNNIKELPNLVFKDLESLEELRLSGNKLSELNKDVFVGLKKLKDLYLDNNQFLLVDKSWFEELPNVQFIDLHSNNIENLNLFVPSLNSLDLSDNKLMQLKDGLFAGLPSLNMLDLSSNIITHISNDAFINLSNLEVLNLEGNKISKLPSEIYRHFSKFTCLALSNNKITDLNAIEFDYLENLLSLNLSHNRIEKLPNNVFARLYSLEELDLHNTLLLDIKPEMFQGLDRLQNLNLSGNQLKKITTGVFKEMPALQVLNLGNVGLTSLNPDTFMGASKLKYLDLQYNPLKIFPEGILRYAYFNCISLRGTKISTLDANVFMNQTQMEELDLRSTAIENLDLIENMPNLRYLQLKDTKFEKQKVIFMKNSTFRKINEDFWDSWCPDFFPECKRD